MFIEPSEMTVRSYLEHWLATYGKPNLAPSTYAGYARNIKQHISRELGHIPLEKLLPMQIQSYYTNMLNGGRRDGKGGLSLRTVQQHHRILRKALQQALKWQLIARNPADACEAPRPKRPEMHVLDDNGVAKLLELIKNHRDREIIITALYTGMREGELLGLRWQDVDLQKRTVHIQQTVGYINKLGFVFREPKTKKSRRKIVLLKDNMEALEQRRKVFAINKLAKGEEYDTEKDLVFCNEFGGPLDPSALSRRFKTVAKAIGAPKLRFHDLRHTHATLLLAQGVHPKVVQERLGHESINITLDIYSHVLPGMQEDAVSKLEAALGFSDGHQMGTKQAKGH